MGDWEGDEDGKKTGKSLAREIENGVIKVGPRSLTKDVCWEKNRRKVTQILLLSNLEEVLASVDPFFLQVNNVLLVRNNIYPPNDLM